MNEPLVSIITTTYNHEKFIGQCIESVLGQSYQHWEQIIVDDGSTDKTSEIVSKYNDSRIKYIHQENIGIWRLSETYNSALKVARGDLIAILEGDDFWAPRKLEKQLPVFCQKDVVLSFGKVSKVNSNGLLMEIYPTNCDWFPIGVDDNYMVIKKLLQHNFIASCTVICRKGTLMDIGGFKQEPYVPFVDYPTWLYLSLRGRLLPINDVLGSWRSHTSQVSSLYSLPMAKGGARLALDFYDNLDFQFKKALGINRKSLLVKQNSSVSEICLQLGRLALFNSDWKGAYINFYSSLSNGTTILKFKAIAGLICSLIRIDFEWIAKLLRKPCLKDMIDN